MWYTKRSLWHRMGRLGVSYTSGFELLYARPEVIFSGKDEFMGLEKQDFCLLWFKVRLSHIFEKANVTGLARVLLVLGPSVRKELFHHIRTFQGRHPAHMMDAFGMGGYPPPPSIMATGPGPYGGTRAQSRVAPEGDRDADKFVSGNAVFTSCSRPLC